ncbi:MAG: class I SAM-dependent RNA methyltransferase, partial [Rectinema sp.]|nr:class I SAM-dependent RNA methyltransferase [Rectinema sp.]
MGTLLRACAVCPIGLEKVLSRDLSQLGYRENGREAGRIFFDIPLARLDEHLARTNIGLRTADRVMLVAGEFSAIDFDGFYEGIRGISWDLFCTKETRLIVERARAYECRLHAQATLQSMAQKAVYDHLMKRFRISTMPETGHALELRIYGYRDRWQVVVDSSGEALSRRGYRRHTHAAPLRETIAAALLFLSGWKRSRPLLDPLCGSGTIAIEAALYARNQAPGLGRHFAFESWPSVNPARIGEVREQFRQSLRADVHPDILARDIDPAALGLARSNAALAGVAPYICFEQGDAREALPDAARSGVLLANPPYG